MVIRAQKSDFLVFSMFEVVWFFEYRGGRKTVFLKRCKMTWQLITYLTTNPLIDPLWNDQKKYFLPSFTHNCNVAIIFKNKNVKTFDRCPVGTIFGNFSQLCCFPFAASPLDYIFLLWTICTTYFIFSQIGDLAIL